MKLAFFFAALVATTTTLASTTGHSGMAKRSTDSHLSTRGPQRLDQVSSSLLSPLVYCTNTILRSRTRLSDLGRQNNESQISSLDNAVIQPSLLLYEPTSRRRLLRSRLRKLRRPLELE